MKFSSWLPRQKALSVLGIDIRSENIHILELCCIKEHFHIENVITASIAQDQIISKPKKISNAILSALRQANIRTKYAITAVSDTSVIKKDIQLDAALTEEDIENHITLEKEKYFSLPADEICVDFAMMDTDLKTHAQRNVKLIAAKRHDVSDRIHALEGAGLSIVAIDVESMALARVIQRFNPPSCAALIFIDKNSLLFEILEKENICYLHHEDITYDTSFHTKEIADHIINQWNWYSAAFSSTVPQQIFLAGNADLSSIANRLRQQIKLPITIVNPFNLPLVSSAFRNSFQNEESWVLSFGLAMWQWS